MTKHITFFFFFLVFLINTTGAGLGLTSLGPMVLEAGFSGTAVEDMRVTGTMSRRRGSRG